MLTIADAVAECALFAGLSRPHLQQIAGCGRFDRFPAGATILREGQVAERVFVLREGSVALEVGSPGRIPRVVQTLGPGEPVGWSWLCAPHAWHMDVVTREPVSALGFDAACLRATCEADHELGYQLMGRIVNVMLHRLAVTRLQLLDVYAHGRFH